jgi:hypothetical protein
MIVFSCAARAGARAVDDVPDRGVAGVSTEVAGVDMKRNAGYR